MMLAKPIVWRNTGRTGLGFVRNRPTLMQINANPRHRPNVSPGRAGFTREDFDMAEAATRLPTKTDAKEPGAWPQLASLRQEMERMFEDFRADFGSSPFRRGRLALEPFFKREWGRGLSPAVDIVEKDNAYEVTAELPGMSEKDIEVKLAGGMLTIKGEKSEEKEEKTKDVHVSERRYGSFQRSFAVPEDIDADKLDASVKNGVLTVTMPKSAEAKKKERKIAVTAK
jgi:HSP20 family protein